MKQSLFLFIVLLMLMSSCGVKPVNNTSNMSIQAWTFPSDKTCDATQDITDSTRHYDVLKPQYYTLQNNGILQLLTAPCNTYSASNVELVKQHSAQQYTTVSGSIAGMDALTSSKALTTAFVNIMLSFLKSSGFTGIEIDFEGFGQWTPQQYSNYKTFLMTLGNALHVQGYKLMIDGPAISDATYQGYYQNWRWEDVNTLPVDYAVVMAYDEQDDQGAGTPVSSLAWTNNICQWMLSKITDHSKIVVGIPSYGYSGKTGSYSVTKDTYQQSSQLPGFSTATRDPNSGEMTWALNGFSYDYSDATTLQLKLNVVQNAGISSVSVWHLGGNQWFPATQPTPSPVPQPTTPTLALTSDQIKAIYGILTPDQIATLKSAIS